LLCEVETEALVEGHEHRGGVGGSSAEPAAGGNGFDQLCMDRERSGGAGFEDGVGFVDEVGFEGPVDGGVGVPVDVELCGLVVEQFDGELVCEVDRVHPGADGVHALVGVGGVCDWGRDLQDQVDLCVGLDRTGIGHCFRVVRSKVR